MAKRVTRKHYNDPDSLAAGTITFTDMADETSAVTFNVAELCGMDEKAWGKLNDYAKWSLLRDANNTHGDAFADPNVDWIAASQARHDKLARGEFGRGGGDGVTAKGMNDYIRALMRVAGLDEDAARDYIGNLDDEIVQENGLTELAEFKKHDQIVAERKKLAIERAQAALAATAGKEAAPFELKK